MCKCPPAVNQWVCPLICMSLYSVTKCLVVSKGSEFTTQVGKLEVDLTPEMITSWVIPHCLSRLHPQNRKWSGDLLSSYVCIITWFSWFSIHMMAQYENLLYTLVLISEQPNQDILHSDNSYIISLVQNCVKFLLKNSLYTISLAGSGSWRTKSFKSYNFKALGVPPAAGHLHPLMKVRSEYRQIFLEMGYIQNDLL